MPVALCTLTDRQTQTGRETDRQAGMTDRQIDRQGRGLRELDTPKEARDREQIQRDIEMRIDIFSQLRQCFQSRL